VSLWFLFFATASYSKPASTDDLWEGATIIDQSGDFNAWPVENIFGTSATLFRDYQNAGFQHYVVWKTAVSISLDSINLIAWHDWGVDPHGDDRDRNYRGFSEFRLYYANTYENSMTDWKLIVTTATTNPYGGGPNYPGENWLELEKSFPVVKGQYFKAVFVQAGDGSDYYGDSQGPRVIELDGYGESELGSLLVYPHMDYIDKGEVLLMYLPNTKVMLSISKGHAIEFENYTEDIFTTEVTTDEGGEARATIIYTYESIEDMLELSPATISALIEKEETDQKIAEYKIDVSNNWNRLLSEYKNPEKCPGARANPCKEWFKVVTGDREYLNGLANNYYELISRYEHRPFYTYKGQSDFVCGAYQDRLLSWFYHKRFNINRQIASQVNGIEGLPYNVANGLHKFVGIFPAGISAQNKLEPSEDCVWFLDPWPAQKPKILTVSDEVFSAKATVIAAGGFTIFSPAAGALLWAAGGAYLYYTDQYEGPWDYLKRIFTTVWGTVRFDSDYKFTIDIPSESNRFDIEQVEQIAKIKQNFDDPECPSLDLIKISTVEDIEALLPARGPLLGRGGSGSTKLHLMCPVAVKVSAQKSGNFTYDLVNNTFSGDLSVLVYSVLDEDGTRIMDLDVSEQDFDIEIKALDKGKFSLCMINSRKTRIAFYENVQINQNDIYNLKVIGNQPFNLLEGPGGVKIIPTVIHYSILTPWLNLLLE